MKHLSALVALFLTLSLASSPVIADDTRGGIPLDQEWKAQLYEFAKINLKHPSWGLAHAERNYHVAVRLAAVEGLTIDNDVLFAAAYLHDLGGLPGFEAEGVDHAVRSAELAPALLASFGFPEPKVARVRETILGHVYYGQPDLTAPEARVFHDADLLEFLGTLGIARIYGATAELSATQSLTEPTDIIRGMNGSLPGKLATAAARGESALLVRETEVFLEAIRVRSRDGRAL